MRNASAVGLSLGEMSLFRVSTSGEIGTLGVRVYRMRVATLVVVVAGAALNGVTTLGSRIASVAFTHGCNRCNRPSHVHQNTALRAIASTTSGIGRTK